MSLKIMIADDEPASLQLIRSLAVPFNHTVVAFDDHQKAVERAEEQRFDVVFVGMRLPELAGLELARRVRDTQPNREAAIVMLSSSDDIATTRKAFGEGADFVLMKPVSAGRIRPMLAAMDSPGWKGKRHAARLPLFTEVHCVRGEESFALKSMNISESGMLLQPSFSTPEGEEVSLEFKIKEVGTSLSVRARVVRKEGDARAAVEFVELTPEARNAIQLYVMGRLAPTQGQTRDATRAWWMGHGVVNS